MPQRDAPLNGPSATTRQGLEFIFRVIPRIAIAIAIAIGITIAISGFGFFICRDHKRDRKREQESGDEKNARA